MQKKTQIAWKANGHDTQELFINRRYAGAVRYVPYLGNYRVEVAGVRETVLFYDRTDKRAKAYLLTVAEEVA